MRLWQGSGSRCIDGHWHLGGRCRRLLLASPTGTVNCGGVGSSVCLEQVRLPRYAKPAGDYSPAGFHYHQSIRLYGQFGRPLGNGIVQVFVVPLWLIVSVAVAEPSYVMTSRRVD